MPDINPLTNNQIFLKKIAENTGSDYETGDVSEINPLTIDQILLKEIAANTAGQSGDITELEEKVTATQDMISDAYDSTHTYNVGDYCIYEDALYKCNTANTTGTWDSSKWDAVTVVGELEDLTEGVTDVSSQLGKAEIYLSMSYDTTSVTFTGIKIKNQSRYPALFIGNGNGTPFMAACALYSANITDVTISDSNMTIAVSNVTDTTYDLTIGGINTWGYYALEVFYH